MEDKHRLQFCRDEMTHVAKRLKKDELADYAARALARCGKEREEWQDTATALRQEVNLLKAQLDNLTAIKRAVDAVVKLRADSAKAGIRDTSTRSLFPDMPVNVNVLDSDEAGDVACVLADIVDKSEAICERLEFRAEVDEDDTERADMLRLLGMDDWQLRAARGKL